MTNTSTAIRVRITDHAGETIIREFDTFAAAAQHAADVNQAGRGWLAAILPSGDPTRRAALMARLRGE